MQPSNFVSNDEERTDAIRRRKKSSLFQSTSD